MLSWPPSSLPPLFFFFQNAPIISFTSASLRASFNINIHESYTSQDTFINVIKLLFTKDNLLPTVNLQPRDLLSISNQKG